MPPLARLAVAAFAGVLVGALGASLMRDEGRTLPRPGVLDPDTQGSADRAIALVVGATRSQDGLLYGEWFWRRFGDDLCLTDAAGFEFLVLAHGPSSDGAARLDVLGVARRDANVTEGCDREDIPALAAVWSDTGEIVPLGDGVNETSVAVDSDERLDRRQVTDEGPLSDFLAGDAP